MDLVYLIHKAISNMPADEPRNYIGASSIGRPCVRETWYSYKGVLKPTPQVNTAVTFEIGKRLEEMLVDYLCLTEVHIERPCQTNNFLKCQSQEFPEFQGHMDGIINFDTVLEIKTAKNSSFAKFKLHGLQTWSYSYYTQLQAYMGMSGLTKGVLIAINKDTSELHSEWVYFDDSFYESLLMKVSNVLSYQVAPERINKNPTYFICSNCIYKQNCHGGSD